METALKQHFSLVWDREELLKEIEARRELSSIYYTWTEEQQREFVDFCTGVRGVKFLYDGFFKELMNPEYAEERLNDFLSLLLDTKVTIQAILPNDSTRIADESTLLITDIVVELSDGSLANVEVQKIGYNFPGQRCACYSSDLLLRQYKRIRGKNGKHFTYKDIKNVYTIVLFEDSPKEFKAFADDYLHHFEQRSDTGLELEFLQKFLLIPLDIFLKKQHNKPVRNKLDAWLLFFASDDPKDVIQLIEEYPEFQEMYEQAYQICRNLENVMGIFSEELRLLDRNTVQLMIDEMQDTIDAQKSALDEKNAVLAEKDSTIAEKDAQLLLAQQDAADKEAALADKEAALADKDRQLADALKQLEELRAKQN